MKYMLLVYSDEKVWTKEEWTACTAESGKVCHDLSAKGQFLGASPLHPVQPPRVCKCEKGTGWLPERIANMVPASAGAICTR